LKESKVAKLLSNIKEIPGQKLFQYYDQHGHIQQLDSDDINAYLREAMQGEYTGKDFRTWAGCLLALHLMTQMPYAETQSDRKKTLLNVIDQVAAQLGNTRTVTRNYYIHPALQLQYVDGKLTSLLKQLSRKPVTDLPSVYSEKAFEKFLKTLLDSNRQVPKKNKG